MFGGGKKTSHSPIGVDVGDHTIRMIQFKYAADKPVATAAAARPLGCGICPKSGDAYHQAVNKTIREMLAEGHFHGNQAVSCLPAASLIYKNIRLPKMPYDELASAVQWEASERLKFSGDAMNVQFFDAGEVLQGAEKRQEVIILAASRQFVDEHIKALCAGELELSAIEAVPSALARCMDVANPMDDQPDAPVRVVIDVGYNGTKVLMTRGPRICFFKLIEAGGRHMDEALAAKLDLPVVDASVLRRDWMNGNVEGGNDARIASALAPVIDEMSREIGLCLRYYSVTFRGRRPEEAWIVGGESGNTWLWTRLCQEVDLKPSPHDPLSTLDLSQVLPVVGGPAQWAGWGVAIGLALRSPTPRHRKQRGAA